MSHFLILKSLGVHVITRVGFESFSSFYKKMLVAQHKCWIYADFNDRIQVWFKLIKSIKLGLN